MEGWTDDTGSDNFQSQNLAKIARGGYDYHAKLGRNNTDDKTVLPRNKEGVESRRCLALVKNKRVEANSGKGTESIGVVRIVQGIRTSTL